MTDQKKPLESYLNPNTYGPRTTVQINLPKIKESEFLSATEVAKLLGITSQAIRKAISKRRLLAKKVGKTWIIGLMDFNSFKERYGY